MITPVSALTKAEARMGNDIARQFAHLPAADAARPSRGTSRRFWDPRMRRALEALAAAHDDSLDPLLVDAAGRLAAHASRSEPDAQSMSPANTSSVRSAMSPARCDRPGRRFVDTNPAVPAPSSLWFGPKPQQEPSAD